MGLRATFRRLATMPAEEIRERAAQRLAAAAERARLALGMAPASRARALGGFDKLPAKAAGLFYSAEGLRQLASEDPAWFATVRRRADGVHAGNIELLGHGAVQVGSPPDWHREPLAGKLAPSVHWSRVPYLDPALVGDHKVLWEFNRHQYLFDCALCWLVQKRADDFSIVQWHLSSWLQSNPPKIGVNWASSLEVAYRALSWCCMLSLLLEAQWDKELLAKLDVSLREHAAHIETYLSTYFSPNTHLTGEALGLFCIGSLLDDCADARRWRDRGSEILCAWADRQVLPDGIYFERASQYHRYTVEIYLMYVHVARRSGWPVGEAVLPCLWRALSTLRSLCDGSGRLPLIGDDDGGVLMGLSHEDPRDVRGLLLGGAAAIGAPELMPPTPAPRAMSMALLGPEPQLSVGAVRSSNVSSLVEFPQGGLVVMRDGWAAHDAVAVVDTGIHGVLNCGHAHADALAMTLSLGTQPLFIDRGTLTYVGSERNEFRSTASHNTLEFDDESSIQPTAFFQWSALPPPPTFHSETRGPFQIVRAEAAGHVATGAPSKHGRSVVHVPGSAWLIIDRGDRRRGHSATTRWQLAPGLDCVEIRSGQFAVRAAGGSDVATVVIAAPAQASARIRAVSQRYGSREQAYVIEAALRLQPFRFATVVIPSGNESAPAFEAEHRLRWRDSVGSHELVFPVEDSSLEAIGWRAHAEALWVMERGGETVVACLGAQQLVTPDGQELVGPSAHGHGGDVVFRGATGSWRSLES